MGFISLVISVIILLLLHVNAVTYHKYMKLLFQKLFQNNYYYFISDWH